MRNLLHVNRPRSGYEKGQRDRKLASNPKIGAGAEAIPCFALGRRNEVGVRKPGLDLSRGNVRRTPLSAEKFLRAGMLALAPTHLFVEEECPPRTRLLRSENLFIWT